MKLCENCEYLHSERKRSPRYWMCLMFPRIDVGNFVTKEERLTDPYMYASQINGGNCPLYKERKEK